MARGLRARAKSRRDAWLVTSSLVRSESIVETSTRNGSHESLAICVTAGTWNGLMARRTAARARLTSPGSIGPGRRTSPPAASAFARPSATLLTALVPLLRRPRLRAPPGPRMDERGDEHLVHRVDQ